MELFEAGHEIKYLVARRGAAGVILLGGADDDVDDIRETAAATAAFFHRMIDFCRHDKLPTVLIEHLDDGVLNVLIGDKIAATNQHFRLPVIRNALNSSHKAKADI
ncbi:hypothetical protein ASE23_19575 [Rhizobium sp. Root73]|nr:hypothetical protein ASC96_21610 [Rhizobium sp. Root1204]KQY02129.1 hypothetical protein ASD36_18705 [Rhizobium sp. Root1334]KRB96031.1 hypothetical protein ASE23_19575 [Rhizobium sp. Root73]